ncbi:UNVERIFIED_CONTAM: WAT1-related protein, partial [Sesamum calycinum]
MYLLSKAAMSSGMKPSVFVVYRQAFATLALLPFAFFFRSKEGLPLTWTGLCKIFVISSFGLALSFNLSFAGLEYVSATFSSAIVEFLLWSYHGCLFKAPLLKQYPGKLRLMVLQCGFSFLTSTIYGAAMERNLTSWKLAWNIQLLSVVYCQGGSSSYMDCTLQDFLYFFLWGPLLKQYPGKLRFLILQCGFSCLTATIYGAAVERNISSWKLSWNIHLLSIAYC